MIIVIYLLLASIVVALSVKLSEYVDIMDKKTNLSGAFIGGVILAAITSLPELFTSLSATMLLSQPELVIGNILGSNIFNTTVLAALFLLFPKRLRRARIGSSHNKSLLLIALVYIYLIIFVPNNLDYTFFGISVHSVVVFIIYVYSVVSMSSDDGVDNKDDGSSPLTLKQVIFRFILCSIGLVAASIMVTYATDIIATQYNIGATLAGALLLGIATSLPELTSSYTLAKMGNHNAMVGNILGSNLFNFAILTLADMTFSSGSLYYNSRQTFMLLLFGLSNTVFVGITILYKAYGRRKFPNLRKTIYIIPSILALLGYLAFLALSA